MKKLSLCLLVTISLFMLGCGGGAAKSGNTPNTNTNTNTNTSNATLKIFPNQTAKIIYETKTIIQFPGFPPDVTTGTKRFIYKDWGNTRLEESETENTSSGDKTHRLTKWVTPKNHIVDFKNEKINVINFAKAFEGLSAQQATDLAITSFGGAATSSVTITGQEQVLGYVCDVVKIGAVTLWEKDGVTLKSEVNLGASIATETAISAHFNTGIPESEFSLPAFEYINAN